MQSLMGTARLRRRRRPLSGRPRFEARRAEREYVVGTGTVASPCQRAKFLLAIIVDGSHIVEHADGFYFPQ